MTERKSTRPTTRRSTGKGLAWKSGLLASSLGAVMLGWTLLAQTDTTSQAAASQPQPRVIVLQVPASALNNLGNAALPSLRNSLAPSSNDSSRSSTLQGLQLQPLPQRPIFRQPLTRTRRS